MARSNVEFAGLKSLGVAVPENSAIETQPSCLYVENPLDILAVKECNTSKVTCGNC